MTQIGLSRAEAQSIQACLGGADILSFSMALSLRDLAKRELVTIADVMGEYSIDENRPYFGAMATREGARVFASYCGARLDELTAAAQHRDFTDAETAEAEELSDWIELAVDAHNARKELQS